MSVSDLSASTQNYLKVIWGLTEWHEHPVTTTLIAERMQVSNSSVSGALRRLADQGLIHHTPYRAVELTDAGRAHAVEMVRRHRLLETFLVDVLGYGPDEVHDEAEVLEHAVSARLVDRIDEHLGHPSRDPHGDPIPAADGTVVLPDAVPLRGVVPGTVVKVERISDEDPELMAHLQEHGIEYGACLEIHPAPAYSETMNLHVLATDGQLSLGRPAIDALYVSVTP